MLGRSPADSGRRDRLVIASPDFHAARARRSGAATAQRTSTSLGIEESLERLRTDYIDMYWMHVWDQTTPADEVLRAFDAVPGSKILRYGSQYAGLVCGADRDACRGRTGCRPVGLQYACSLIDRGVELDLMPASASSGLGMVPWSRAPGLLTKYGQEMLAEAGRATALPANLGDIGERRRPAQRRQSVRRHAVYRSAISMWSMSSSRSRRRQAARQPRWRCLGGAARRRFLGADRRQPGGAAA